MNWSLAKNISIVCLIVLNVLLVGLVYSTSAKYTLTAEQEQALAAYLSRSNVSLNGEPVKNFVPMPSLKLAPPAFTTEVAQSAEAFMAQNQDLMKGFALDKAYEQDGVTILEYRAEYESTVLYDSLIRFTPDSDGTAIIDVQISEVTGTDGAARDILSPDAALYLFVQNANYIFGDEPITVDSMDIVYINAENDTAVPGYRFYLQDSDIPVLMNAYTNEIVAGF